MSIVNKSIGSALTFLISVTAIPGGLSEKLLPPTMMALVFVASWMFSPGSTYSTIPTISLFSFSNFFVKTGMSKKAQCK